ncbi:mycothiol-dependent maleylpyruvate isomerase [Nocardia otitidiscaviarum]|uniref:Mycothiol-dependent maleylpyruvate isomerase n=1 Tax=Nocardia otitidiscaviarum TaxID=1823 RepID=A0A378YJ75_9NOCA|nr:maleylpyruvate isomerase family mycothiol-dependent enzyme [Nocardia otitidiscaviarum]MBF6235536.1 maleylpyruvate isomerase N-terminal domain-containing protein [Nocardia otitidiscaviarum]SUA77192.1 mycothiol-dependent maleylpyruvate isomerase [Nocardia otitidiscaviarum]
MTDTVPDRERITADLSDQWDALAHLVDGLDEGGWRTASSLPGWTVFDVIAHIIGTESMLLGELPPEADVTGLEHVRNEVGALNEKWIESLRPLSGAELMVRYREVTDRRRKALAAMDDAAWAEPVPSPVGMVPYGRFMRVRIFDCWMHELDIADGLRASVDEGGPRAESAFPELVLGLGRAAVKGAGAPDGSRITLEIGGATPHTVHLTVDGGRAHQVEALDGPATVVVGLDSGLFARLRGGRTDAAAHADEIALSGDTDLGDRLVRSLAFTI